jgi:hypothetical protein
VRVRKDTRAPAHLPLHSLHPLSPSNFSRPVESSVRSSSPRLALHRAVSGRVVVPGSREERCKSPLSRRILGKRPFSPAQIYYPPPNTPISLFVRPTPHLRRAHAFPISARLWPNLPPLSRLTLAPPKQTPPKTGLRRRLASAPLQMAYYDSGAWSPASRQGPWDQSSPISRQGIPSRPSERSALMYAAASTPSSANDDPEAFYYQKASTVDPPPLESPTC